MNEYFYMGYNIVETEDGYYQVGDFEFPSYDEAIEWIDDVMAEPAPVKSKLHTYLFFYVDKATDQAFQATVKAQNLQEAKSLLRDAYDVYMITDYDILD